MFDDLNVHFGRVHLCAIFILISGFFQKLLSMGYPAADRADRASLCLLAKSTLPLAEGLIFEPLGKC